MSARDEDPPARTRPEPGRASFSRLREFAKDHRALVGGAILAYLVLIVALALVSWQAVRLHREVTRTREVNRSLQDLLVANEAERAEPPTPSGLIEVEETTTFEFDPTRKIVLRVAASPAKEFQFPYYLSLPGGLDESSEVHLLVETNNTGTATDDFELHDERARQLATASHATRLARKLGAPLLVPVFPRPGQRWRIYTHSLDDDTLRLGEGPLKRIDLQLIRMIRDAQALLRRHDVTVADRIFMHGFSASGTFANRFAILHPGIVRAVAAGGVNGIPTFPTREWKGQALTYPVGIADLKEITGIEFDEQAYRGVSQYIYMGYLDRNDTTLSRDTYREEHAALIRTRFGAEIPARWKVSQSIYDALGVSAQMVTYDGTSHTIRPEMLDDVAAFFAANSDPGFVRIEPHRYPFVEYRELQRGTICGLLWRGDDRLPQWARNLSSEKDSFIITIEEWIPGQDHRQLTSFRERAGFEFVLTAKGHEVLAINRSESCGTMSSSDGRFQGFVVRLSTAQLERLPRGVEYEIRPRQTSGEVRWSVGDGVRLRRP